MASHSETDDSREGAAELFKVEIAADWSYGDGDSGMDDATGFNMGTERGGENCQYQHGLNLLGHGEE